MNKRSATTEYSLIVNGRFNAGTFASRKLARHHVRTLGAIIEVEGSKYPVNTVELVSQTTTYRTLTTYTPKQTTVFIADELDSDLTDTTI